MGKKKSKYKYTPGPWTSEGTIVYTRAVSTAHRGLKFIVVSEGEREVIADTNVKLPWGRTLFEAELNARIIAKVPEMVQLLEHAIRSKVLEEELTEKWYAKAREVLKVTKSEE